MMALSEFHKSTRAIVYAPGEHTVGTMFNWLGRQNPMIKVSTCKVTNCRFVTTKSGNKETALTILMGR